MSRVLSYTMALREAMQEALRRDPSVFIYGLGVPDPKAIFGSTLGLQEEFGSDRVFDMPTAENGMTGVGVGAALTGSRPVLISQRLDFYLLAMDQLVNNAAKWHYMFGGAARVPLTVRLILGRGWGQGPTHSQSLQSWFAHIPGLKVVMPALPDDAYGLMLASILDDNPVVFLDHRWLHNTQMEVPDELPSIPLGRARVLREGSDCTVVSMSLMSVEAIRAAEFLSKHGVNAEVIDLRSVAPIDWETIFASVVKTGRLVVCDTSHLTCSVSAEIVARVVESCFQNLLAPPKRVALPDVPTPTSSALTQDYYPGAEEIVAAVAEVTATSIDLSSLMRQRSGPHDVPGDWFTGPF